MITVCVKACRHACSWMWRTKRMFGALLALVVVSLYILSQLYSDKLGELALVKKNAEEAAFGVACDVTQPTEAKDKAGTEENNLPPPSATHNNKSSSSSSSSSSSNKSNNNKAADKPVPPPANITNKVEAPKFGNEKKPESPQVNKTSSKRYLIFVCDPKDYCYGLGDRQRGVVGVYLLAAVTNRTFGIIMDTPSPFREFYKPHLVNWDIPESELKGKSNLTIKAYGNSKNLPVGTMDFNKEHPQDVVYIKTNQKLYYGILGNRHYKNSLPPWARVPVWEQIGQLWLRLVTPTDALREALNQLLANITQVIHDEALVWKQLKGTGCCSYSHPNAKGKAAVGALNTTRVAQCCVGADTKVQKINCSSAACPPSKAMVFSNGTNTSELSNTTFSISTKECTNQLAKRLENKSELDRVSKLTNSFCQYPNPPIVTNVSVEDIHKKKGHDMVDLKLVCAHIRIGHSKTLPFENNRRNKPGSVKVVWKFLKPYMERGHHVYLATDSQEVRDEARALFGDRLHVSEDKIVHIAVKKKDGARQGLRLALAEQLLLSTSCDVLLVSKSGFSENAARIRHALHGRRNVKLLIFWYNRIDYRSIKYLH